MGIRFGLDIGVASVGVAVIDDDYNILEASSLIFEEADASKNIDRRSSRGSKRLFRRKYNRIKDFKRLWKRNNFNIPNYQCNNQLELKIKELKEELNRDELYFVLLNALKHRGISYLDEAQNDNVSNKSDYSKAIEINRIELQEKFPCEIQYDKYKKYGKFRGDNFFKYEDENKLLNNVFTTSSYRAEVTKILNNQTFLSEDFINKYLEIFDRKREYYVGPGNEKSRTDYGRYTTKKDKDGNYITEDNIFGKLIGKCTFYKDELRAAAASYTAQEFNILNDLNNITIEDVKLDKKQKEEIIYLIKTSKIANVENFIAKVTGLDKKIIKGARIDKNEKHIYHKFEQYNKMRKELEKEGIDINDFSRNILDEIGNILTLNTERDGIVNAFKKSTIINFDDKITDFFVNFRKNNSSLFSKWHSFSLKLMMELIPEMYEESKNQMEVLTERGLFDRKNEMFRDYKKIPKELILEDLYNPVVRKAVSRTIDALNALIKKYGYPDEIIIEMARDKNSKDKEDRIKKAQKSNENEMKLINEKLKNEYGITLTDVEYRQNKNLNLKLKLWNEQGGRCLYSGKYIDINDLIYNNKGDSLYEIDHIIPKSISFDDSRSNKVLVRRIDNQRKGNKTPYMYLTQSTGDWTFDDYMDLVLNLKFNKKKRNLLLFKEDITKIDVLKGFIQRNINDTRYTSRIILNTLQNYFKEKESDTKIRVINGISTSYMRKNLNIKKDREESYSHHAVDAMLMCYFWMGYDAYRKFQEDFIDFENEEITDKVYYLNKMDDKNLDDKLYLEKWSIIRHNINKAEKKVKFSHKVDKKANRSISDQTIYGTREINNKIVKISKVNIFDDFNKFKNIVNKKNGKERFLMYHNDRKTFDSLMKIMEDYKDAKNPFVEYERETGDFVRKYSKKHNGPRVSVLKYENGEVKYPLDISHKYGHEKGSKKVILDSLKPYRTDVYYNEKDKKYALIGVKYADCRFKGGKAAIDKELYTRTLKIEGLLKEDESMKDLESLGWRYKFSLYKNDIIEYEKNGEIYKERFLSRTLPSVKNYIETKPINAPRFDRQNRIGLSKTRMIKKYRTDILGNTFLAKDEKFSLDIDIY